MAGQRAQLIAMALTVAACGGAVGDGVTTTASSPAPSTTAPASPNRTGEIELLPPQEIPPQLSPMSLLWETDFSKATIDLNELLVGIPASDPRDLIPPIDDPVFSPVSENAWLTDRDPGVVLEIGDEARFYPLAILTRHEIVNDELGDLAVAVTYCPLCNTAVVFDRRFDGKTIRLGVSGLLRNSDLVMWDDASQSLWQQITGEAVVGEYAGRRLTPIGSAIVSWADFAETYPDGLAMSDDQGSGRTYGSNPYEFYSSRPAPYSFFQGEIDDRFPALERVVGVTIGDVSKAYPFSILQRVTPMNDTLNGQPLVVVWGSPDTADALDSGDISEARAVGTGLAFSSQVDGRTLTFEAAGDSEFKDIETGTTWSILGKAIDGELAGAELEILPHHNEFWFAWQAFFPDASVLEG
jgi:hypothetical protein